MDYDLEGYQKLTGRVGIPILPSGNWIQDLPSLQKGPPLCAWTSARTDVTVCRGLKPARKALAWGGHRYQL